MLSKTFVSVVIPAYNKENTIRQAIDSIFRQSYHSLEVIVIEDNSTDRTLSHCKRYFNDITLVCHDDNEGLYSSRIEAIDYAQGDFITFVDADDWLEPNAIFRSMVTALDRKADIVQMKMNRRLSKWNLPFPINNKYDKKRAIEGCLYDPKLFPVSCCGKLYRRDLLMNAEYIDFDGFWGEDRIFNIAAYNQKPKIEVNLDAVYNYRWGGESVNCFKEDVINDYVGVYETKKIWAKQNGYDHYIPQMEQELRNLLFYYIRHMIDSEMYTRDEIITFLGYELSNTPWIEFRDLPSPEKIYTKCYNSLARKFKKKLRSYF